MTDSVGLPDNGLQSTAPRLPLMPKNVRRRTITVECRTELSG